jgi:hypothetical protein
MKKIYLVIPSTVLFFSLGCGNGLPVTINQSSKSFQYSFNDNGCKTETHKFNSKKKYCLALKNDALNKFCAYEMRQIKYQQQCE